MNYWLIKSEGACYSIEDLEKDKKIDWVGVRNFQARNFMRNDMKVGDMALFYHSNSKPSGVYGVARVASPAHPDLTALDKKDEHYDPRSTKTMPIWECVDFEFVQKFRDPISLQYIKIDPKLSDMLVAKKGQRLSVMHVSKTHFERVVARGNKKA
jgi:predicted RNA-binding protein with PUA-like domain